MLAGRKEGDRKQSQLGVDNRLALSVVATAWGAFYEKNATLFFRALYLGVMSNS